MGLGGLDGAIRIVGRMYRHWADAERCAECEQRITAIVGDVEVAGEPIRSGLCQLAFCSGACVGEHERRDHSHGHFCAECGDRIFYETPRDALYGDCRRASAPPRMTGPVFCNDDCRDAYREERG